MMITTHSDGRQRYICKGTETHRWTPESIAQVSMPMVSVICPTKDRRGFIPRLLNSFMTQDYSGQLELIIVEDGAGDCSDLVALAGPQIDRLVWHCRAEGDKPTLGSSLNQAIRLAQGEYIVRFDDDDWQSPCRITRQMQMFEMTGKSVVACSTGLYWHEGDAVAYEYTGDPWLSSGFSHAFTRAYGLAHPHAEVNKGEDIQFAQQAYDRGELATISGAPWLVARNHVGNTCQRRFEDPAERERLLSSDNWREVPVERVIAILGPSSQQ